VGGVDGPSGKGMMIMLVSAWGAAAASGSCARDGAARHSSARATSACASSLVDVIENLLKVFWMLGAPTCGGVSLQQAEGVFGATPHQRDCQHDRSLTGLTQYWQPSHRNNKHGARPA
jgi:hypothetical protein